MRNSFNAVGWENAVLKAQTSFMALDALTADERAIKTHVAEKFPDAKNLALTELQVKQGLEDAHSIHRRQMLVLSVSYIESMIFEFLCAFFEARPQCMHDHLTVNGQKGLLSLKIVNAADSKQDLLFALANQSAQAVLGLKYESRFARIKTLTNTDYPIVLLESLLLLHSDRNDVVHGAEDEEIHFSIAWGGLRTAMEMTHHLEAIAVRVEVPLVDRPPPRPRGLAGWISTLEFSDE